MKKLFLTIILVLIAVLNCKAQIQEISFTAGVNVPMYKDIENDVTFSLNYSHFWHNGLGFRSGIQLTPSVSDVDDIFGVPIAFVWHSHSRSFHDASHSAILGAADALRYGWSNDDGDVARNIAGGFLMNLFNSMEFFAGVTPGYIAGSSSSVSKASWGNSWQYWEETWTEKKHDLFLTLDAGFSLNYSLGRFELKLVPAFHYNVMDSLVYHSISGQTGNDLTETAETPLKWFFTLSGGISFRF